MMDDLAAAKAAEVLAYEAKELQWFLNHDGVRRAFMATVDRITKEWEKAPDVATREFTRAKLDAFKTLMQELRAHAQRKVELVK